jgi:hypothetical protein
MSAPGPEEHALADEIERHRVESRATLADLERLNRSLARSVASVAQHDASLVVATLASLVWHSERYADRILSAGPR